jgi:SpoIID/LytB domain protein
VRKPTVVIACVALCALTTPAMAAAPSPTPVASSAPDRVVFTGTGSAHGLGMAMDGVEGQARAGWSHDRILSLFYAGTSVAHTFGTIRVWIAEGGAERVTLPSGGTVSDASGKFRSVRLPAGAGLTVVPASGGRLALRIDGLPVAQKTAAATPRPTSGKNRSFPSGIGVVPPTAPPLAEPTPTPPRPTPTPTPQRRAPAPTTNAAIISSPLTIAPQGQPALTSVTATGRRYRGTIELRRAAGSVRVINRVSLEDYVSGIAEEKGAGWPLQGMKALAVAARTLGVATITWLDNHHADGYDICPTDKCQVYLGYDGEEPIMRQAAYETAGEIRTYNGRAIVAMYHGNGGGQTSSYKEASGDASDAYPYLRSVKYPYADPWHWRVTTTLHEIQAALLDDNVKNLPTPLEYVFVLKRGESPRVQRVGLFGNSTHGIAVKGIGFAHALKLPSNWFYVHLPHKPPRSIDAAFLNLSDPGSASGAARHHRAFPWPLSLAAIVLAAAAAGVNWSTNGGASSLTTAWTKPQRRVRRPKSRRDPSSNRLRRRRQASRPAPDATAG